MRELLFNRYRISALQDEKVLHGNMNILNITKRTSLVAQMVKCLAYNVGDLSSIPGSGRSSGEGNGKPLQYSCLENPVDGRAW